MPRPVTLHPVPWKKAHSICVGCRKAPVCTPSPGSTCSPWLLRPALTPRLRHHRRPAGSLSRILQPQRSAQLWLTCCHVALWVCVCACACDKILFTMGFYIILFYLVETNETCWVIWECLSRVEISRSKWDPLFITKYKYTKCQLYPIFKGLNWKCAIASRFMHDILLFRA